MRSTHKKLFVDAMLQHAQRKTKDRKNPMVFKADRFFMDACDLFYEERGGERVPRELIHPFSRNDDRVIIQKFFDEFQRRCLGKNIRVIKASESLIILREFVDENGKRRLVTLHNQEAVVNDEDRTHEFFRRRAMLTRNNPAIGFVLFGESCNCVDHPLLQVSIEQRRSPKETMVKNFDHMVQCDLERGLLTNSYAKSLLLDDNTDPIGIE